MNDADGLQDILQIVIPNHLLKLPKTVLSEIEDNVAHLIRVAGDNAGTSNKANRQRALSALLYLLDPYDAIHDCHGVLGYADDITVIKETCRDICAN